LKLLLHVCCAPCAIYPAKEAKTDNINLTGFFYNPNIQPQTEYEKRKQETENYFKSEKTKLIAPEYDPNIFLKSVNTRGNSSERCKSCWMMRIKKAANFAKENDFDCFTTTLLGSPYQDHEVLRSICSEVEQEESIKFYYKDFRKGFKDAHKLAREKNIYCQNYCGCGFSLIEKEEAKKAK